MQDKKHLKTHGNPSGDQWRGMALCKLHWQKKKHLVTTDVKWRPVHNADIVSPKTGVFIFLRFLFKHRVYKTKQE